MNTVLKSNLAACVLILAIVFSGIVFAGDVIVKSGNVEASGKGTFIGGVVCLSEELIDDPEFDDESDWDETDGWDVNDTDGTATSNGGDGDTLEEASAFTVKSGTDYLVEVDVIDSGGGIVVSLGGDSKTITATGLHILTFTTTSTAALDVNTLAGAPTELTSLSVKESGPVEGGYMDVLDTIDIGSKLYLTGTAAFDLGTLNITGPNGVFVNGDTQDACDVLVVTGGAGANYAGPGSKGADIFLTAGTGGSSTGSNGGAGGDVTITTGSGANGGEYSTAGDGGDIELTTGAGGTAGTNGSYGDVIIAKNGGLVILNLPTQNPNVAGALWNDNGTVKISSGE